MENKSLLPSNHRLLTVEEEKLYGTQVQAMLKAEKELETCTDHNRISELQNIIKVGQNARNQFFMHNINLVRKNAYAYLQTVFPLMEDEDLIQYGLIGLNTAIDKFNPDLGNKFSTHATWWIRQAINRNINNSERLIRIPENRLAQITKMNMLARENHTLTEHDVTELIKKELGLDDKTLYTLRNAITTPASLEAPLSYTGDNNENSTIADSLISEQETSGEEQYLVTESQGKIRDMVRGLTEQEISTLFAFYEVEHNGSVMEKKDVIERYGWNDRKFSTVKSGALRKLRNNVTEKGLKIEDFLVTT